ncbi:unnamed protein product [Rangifer tarandus platyrhynchus]|uniref:Uncharacterized protein n=2 Tax=Rangifer tarandus platyrhynchus TaxID=3082113 RepID=A0ABN8ZCS2_RANTA|nr:unnamed protein product [Rangifer tarandus platyrhynchus]
MCNPLRSFIHSTHIFLYLLEFASYYPLEGFPGGPDSKESACNAGDLGLIPGSGRSPGGGPGYPLQYSGLENPHGQRSPWGRKESDMTEHTHACEHTHTQILKFRRLTKEFCQE